MWVLRLHFVYAIYILNSLEFVAHQLTLTISYASVNSIIFKVNTAHIAKSEV